MNKSSLVHTCSAERLLNYSSFQRVPVWFGVYTAQKKFPIKGFFSKLRIWSHLLKKSLMENFFFCAVISVSKVKLNCPTLNVEITKNTNITKIIEVTKFRICWWYLNCGNYECFSLFFTEAVMSCQNQKLNLLNFNMKRVKYTLKN